MTPFYLIIQFRSLCLKFAEPPCCFEILLHQDSSNSSILSSDFVSEVLIWTGHGSIQKTIFECQCRVIWLLKTWLSKNLSANMYKPVKCKLKISVRIWVWCLQKGVKYIGVFIQKVFFTLHWNYFKLLTQFVFNKILNPIRKWFQWLRFQVWTSVKKSTNVSVTIFIGIKKLPV